MSDFITLACPCCAGSLRVTADAERFKCQHCGQEHLVRNQGGHVALLPMVKHLERMNQAMDRQASELAIRRLEKDRKKLVGLLDGWREDFWDQKDDYQSCRFKFWRWCVVGGFVSLTAFALLVSNRQYACGFSSAMLIDLFFGALALQSFFSARKLSQRIEAVRNKLHELSDRLSECDEELDFHERSVRVRR